MRTKLSKRNKVDAPRNLKHVPLVLSALLMSGCFPYFSTYYLPESVEGYRSGHSVLTSDEPVWILERDGATFYFTASRDESGRTTFKLNIEPLRLPGQTSLWAKKREEARAAVKPVSVDFTDLRAGALVTSNGTEMSSDSVRVVSGQYGTNNRGTVNLPTNEILLPVDHYLEVSAVHKGKESRVHIVQWPSMLINGKLVQLPPIQFRWTSGMQVQFLNG